VSLTEENWVICDVRYLSLFTFSLKVSAMAQVVNRQPLTAETRLRFQVYVRSVVVKVALRQVFVQVFRFSPANIIPPMLHARTSSTRCFYRKDKRAKPGNLQKAILFRKSQKRGCRTLTAFSSHHTADCSQQRHVNYLVSPWLLAHYQRHLTQ